MDVRTAGLSIQRSGSVSSLETKTGDHGRVPARRTGRRSGPPSASRQQGSAPMASTPAPVRRFDRPHRPLPLRAANLVGPLVARVRPSAFSLDPDELEAAARRTTGLDDLGTDEYRPALEALTTSLEREARLTPAGRYFARG